MVAMVATTLLTSDQFLALPMQYDRCGNRIRDELIAGEVVVKPVPCLRHSLVQAQIAGRLMLFLNANPQLRLKCLVGLGVHVGKFDSFATDVCVTTRSRLTEPTEFFQGSPELAIEIVSDTDTAQHLKRKIDSYIEGGAMSVWIVYPEASSVVVYAKDSIRELKGDQSITDPMLPGFSSPVAAFFELT
jgi:Uma2 family endonuclease